MTPARRQRLGHMKKKKIGGSHEKKNNRWVGLQMLLLFFILFVFHFPIFVFHFPTFVFHFSIFFFMWNAS